MADETTQVTKKEVSAEELNDLLSVPGTSTDSVMIPDEGKPNVFSRRKVDLNFLNEDKKNTDKAKPAATADTDTDIDTDKSTSTQDGNEIVNELVNDSDDDANNTKKKSSSIKNLSDTIGSLIKKGKLIPFDDDKPISEYTEKDFEELLDANFTERENKLKEEVPAEFFSSLPEELQVAAKYVMDGGKDLKGLFSALGQAEEVMSMDPTDPNNHEQIVRQFLTTTGFGTSDEIDEEIAGMKDRDELEKKAAQFKPKLDKMQQAIINQKLAEQEQRQAAQADAAKRYVGSVYKTLETGDLNGVKMDRKTQELLYAGLVQAKYPSISGKSTNLLGHLLEKYQYVEPDHSRIAEALWLLADPDGFKSRLMEKGKSTATEKTVRMLKTEEANRTTGSATVEKDETSQRRIPRSNPHFFKR